MIYAEFTRAAIKAASIDAPASECLSHSGVLRRAIERYYLPRASIRLWGEHPTAIVLGRDD